MKWLDRLFQKDPSGRRKDRAPIPVGRTAPGPGVRAAGKEPAGSRGVGTRSLAKFQAVSIVPCLEACPAAQMAQATRFLTTKAPRLPLPDCATPGTCSCRFRKYEDRRRDVQRSPYQNVGGFSYSGSERRRTKGRRTTDR